MEQRQCHPCTACCEGWITSTHIDMSPGEPCAHRCDQGCRIYATRPENPCRTFECGWLQPDSPLPDEMRPDRCGAIVVFNQRFLDMEVFVAAPVGAVIPEATMRWLMRFAMQNKLPLLYWENRQVDGRYTGQIQRGFGPPAFRAAAASARGPIDVMSSGNGP